MSKEEEGKKGEIYELFTDEFDKESLEANIKQLKLDFQQANINATKLKMRLTNQLKIDMKDCLLSGELTVSCVDPKTGEEEDMSLADYIIKTEMELDNIDKQIKKIAEVYLRKFAVELPKQ